MRRSISFMVFALTAGALSIVSPAAGAATSSSISGTVASPGSFGVRLADVPVSEANNPRGLRYIIDYLPTGTVIHRRIFIENEEPWTARFTVYADAAHITGGLFIGDSGATRNELTDWISVQHPAVTLAAGASVTDMITIKVPQGATQGEHYGAIWVQQTSAGNAGAGVARSNVNEVTRVGIRVYLAVGRGGAPPTSFAIMSITGQRPADGQPLLVTHVDNRGGRAVDLGGSARLAGGPGNSAAGPFTAKQVITLAPGQSGNLTFAPPKSLPDGPWRATVSLVSGLTTATGSATVQFTTTIVAAKAGLGGMKWIWLALGGLILVLVIFMGVYALRHRRPQAAA